MVLVEVRARASASNIPRLNRDGLVTQFKNITWFASIIPPATSLIEKYT